MTTAIVDSPDNADAQAWWFLDTLVVEHRCASEMETVVLEMTLPVGSAPPLHVHDDLDDTWYILEGEMVVDMRVVLRIDDPPMTFFSLDTPGNNHDFALMESDAGSSTPADDATGLAHVAFKIGSSAEELRLARSVLETERTPVLYEAERRFTRSLHVIDPDGNEIELYVDVSDT